MKKINVGAQRAKNVAREQRKSANPKSQRGLVNKGLMTKGEAIEQATIKRAGVQAKGRAATAGRAVERGVQERAARVVTRKAEEQALKNMAARAAGSTLKGRALNVGKAVLGRAAAPITAFTTGYAVGTVLNDTFDLSTKIGDYADFITGKSKKMKESMTTKLPPKAAASQTKTPTSGAATTTKASAPTKKTASAVKRAPTKPMTSSKGVDSVGQASYDMHTAFFKELEAGGRASWNAQKAVEASSMSPVEISKPTSSGTTLQAELDKFQSSGGKAPKKDVQIGGLFGRSEGKWHLRKKAGKG